MSEISTASNSERPPLAEYVRMLRMRALLTQEELAALAGLSIGTVRGIEAGRIRRPRSGSLRLLADALALTEPERQRLLAVTHTTAAGGPAPPRHLPAAVASFTGRAYYLRKLDALLMNGDTVLGPPVVLITGTAGVGKTALAVQWAHLITDPARQSETVRSFPHGQLYLDLRGYASGQPLQPGRALTSLLRALGVPPERCPTEVDDAAGLFRSQLAGKRLLMILDNARNAGQVRPLLPGGPQCLVIVTSRDRLSGLVSREGAHRLDLDVMSADDAQALLGRVLGENRAAAEPRATADLARTCARLPLALRIAAATLIDHPHRSIADHVHALADGHRLAALQVDHDDQASVRAAFDLSYRALSEPAQRLFRLLGLVPGPDITREAAAALAAITVRSADELLNGLAAANLLVQPAAGRYTFHDLLRLYAREQCSVNESQSERSGAVERLLYWYLRSADAAAGLLYPHTLRLPTPSAAASLPATVFDGPAEARAWLEAEETNLVALIQHAIDHGPRPLAWLLTACLRGYYVWRRGHFDDLRATLQDALAVAREASDRYGEAVMLHCLADMLSWQDRNDEALAYFEQAARLFVDLNDQYSEAICRYGQGAIHRVQSRYVSAAQCLEAALAVFTEQNQPRDEAAVKQELGILHMDQGNFDDAQECFEEALDLAQRAVFRIGKIRPLRGLGVLQYRQGNLDVAERHLTESQDLSCSLGDWLSEVHARTMLAEVNIAQRRYSTALDLLTSSLEAFRHVGDTFNEAFVLRGIGDAHRLNHHPTAARQALERALAIWERLDMPLWHARTLVTIGDLQADEGQSTEAQITWRRALAVFERVSAPDAAQVANRLRSYPPAQPK